MLFLSFNGILKFEIGVYSSVIFNYIVKINKYSKKIQLFWKNFLSNKRIQGNYKKIVIINKRINFLTTQSENIKTIFQIITHTKEMLILLKINGHRLNLNLHTRLFVISFEYRKIHNIKKNLYYKSSKKFNIGNVFIQYLVNYFVLIYLSRIKYFYIFFNIVFFLINYIKNV